MSREHELSGDLHIATVVVNVQDVERAVSFGCAALGHRRR